MKIRHFFYPGNILGLLFSPSRGLFIFSPVLAFALYGVFLRFRRQGFSGPDIFLAVIILVYLFSFTFGGRWMWYGGHAFGPRYSADLVPYFIFFLIPVLVKASTLGRHKKTVFIILFFCATLAGFAVHYRGAIREATWTWNIKPVNIDDDHRRLWDWGDPQFLR
jgi:hypothetical protein